MNKEGKEILFEFWLVYKNAKNDTERDAIIEKYSDKLDAHINTRKIRWYKVKETCKKHKWSCEWSTDNKNGYWTRLCLKCGKIDKNIKESKREYEKIQKILHDS